MTFFKILEGAKTIAIGGHVRPDGDCVGSCMGMYLYIKDNFPEKQVDIYLQNIPEALKIIDRMDEIKEEIEQNFTEKFSGHGNSGRIMFSWNDDRTHATTFDIPKTEDFGEKYQALEKSTRQQGRFFLRTVLLDAGRSGHASQMVHFAAHIWRRMTDRQRAEAAGESGYVWVKAIEILYFRVIHYR